MYHEHWPVAVVKPCMANFKSPGLNVLCKLLPAAELPGVFQILTMPGLQLRCTLLHFVPQCRPVIDYTLALHTIASFSNLQSLELSDDIVTQASFWSGLTNLHKLVLHDLRTVPQVLSTLPSLNSLSLRVSQWSHSDQNFTQFSRQTELSVGLVDGPSTLPGIQVILPVGSNIQLRKLKLKHDSWCEHLQEALLLTCLECLARTCAQAQAWPDALPNLQTINVPLLDDSSDDPVDSVLSSNMPPEWQHYTSLQHITLRNWQLTELPAWLTSLQRLRVLELCDADFEQFDCTRRILLQLPCLQTVDVGVLKGVRLANIVVLPSLPALSQLTFGYDDSKPGDAQQMPDTWLDDIIAQLQHAFVDHPSGRFHTEEFEDMHSACSRFSFRV